jgi:parallel beta-helix repeat protein
LVQGNKIGTNAAGTAALGNTFDGINLNDASSNRIIGNVVSGNGINNGNQDAAGINLESNDQFNIIAGNEIGTNAAGDAMLGNSLHGIFLGNGSSNNTIGGTTVNDRNVISGNGKFPVADFATQGGVGVYIFGANTSSNVVQGNYIGTNAAGTAALTNSVIGVLINQSSGNTVQGNLISGNRSVGVEIAGSTATGNQVQGNMIGTDAGGTRAIPNGLDGIFINGAPHNTIGGTAAGAGNLISANLSAGIQIYGAGATNNQIFRNRIGLDANGRPTLPNGTKPLVTGIFSQISIQKNDFGFSTVNRNLGQVLPWQSPASIGGGTVSGDSQAAVAAQRKASLAGSVSGRHRALSKRKTVIVTAVHSYPNAKLALGLSRKSPA